MPNKYPGYRYGTYHRSRGGYGEPCDRRHAPSWNVASEFLDEFYLGDESDGEAFFADDDAHEGTAEYYDWFDNITLQAFVRPHRHKKANIGDVDATSPPGDGTLNTCAKSSDKASVNSPAPYATLKALLVTPSTCSNSRAQFARLLMQRKPARPPSLVRQSSDPISGALPAQNLPKSLSMGRSLSAPSLISDFGASMTKPYTEVFPGEILLGAAVLPTMKSLPAAAKNAELLPTLCLAATIRGQGCSEAAVEVTWRTGRGGYMARVLPVIGVSAEACVGLEESFQRDVGAYLDKLAGENWQEVEGRKEVRVTAVPQAALTSAVAAAWPSLEAALSSVAAGGGRRLLLGSAVAAGARTATGVGTTSLSAFDRWLEAEAAEATIEASLENDATTIPATALIFGEQTCVVCAESSPIPNLSTDGLRGGAALAHCGHWTCAECWQGYLTAAAGSGAARVGCPAYRCPSKLTRAALAHLVPQGTQGAALFAKLEQFRADKARFLRRVNPITAIEEDNNSETGANAVATSEGDVAATSSPYPARYCPNPHCDNLLRAEVSTKPIKALGKLPKNGSRKKQSGCDRSSRNKSYSNVPMLVCSSCSATTCAACGGDEGHLGLTCDEQKRYAAAAAELEKEAASLKWLSDFTKPCPKCSYPIEKNGGCLHMRCQQCSYYFCWSCSGPGTSCQSFRCLKSGNSGSGRKANLDSIPLSTWELNTSQKLLCHKAAAHALARRQALQRSSGDGSKMLESQLFVVLYLLWLRSWADLSPAPGSSRIAVPQSGCTTAVGEARSCVELVLHVLAERTHKSRQENVLNHEIIRVGSDKTDGGLHQKSQRARSLRKMQAQASRQRTRGPSNNDGRNGNKGGREWQSGRNVSAFEALMQDRELAELLAAPWLTFKAAAVRACKDAMTVLAAVTPPSLPAFVPWSSEDSKPDNAVAVRYGRGSKKNRGSSRPAEDLLRRAHAFSGDGLPGGVARKGRMPGSTTMQRGVPPWQDKRGLLLRKESGRASMNTHEQDSEEEEEIKENTDEVEQEVVEGLDEDAADDDEAAWMKRAVPWKGRAKALALSRTQHAWGLMVTENDRGMCESY